VQSGKSEDEEVTGERKNWYQNEVDEEIKGADSRDKVKHNDITKGAISYF